MFLDVLLEMFLEVLPNLFLAVLFKVLLKCWLLIYENSIITLLEGAKFEEKKLTLIYMYLKVFSTVQDVSNQLLTIEWLSSYPT